MITEQDRQSFAAAVEATHFTVAEKALADAVGTLLRENDGLRVALKAWNGYDARLAVASRRIEALRAALTKVESHARPNSLLFEGSSDSLDAYYALKADDKLAKEQKP